MKLSIGQKLLGGSLIFVMAMGGMLAGTWVSLSHLRGLQDSGMALVRTASDAEQLSGQGAALYQIIADAEINHQLDQTKQDWQAEKTHTETMYADLAARLTSNGDKAELEQSREGYKAYVDMFEQKMLPALEANADMTPQIRDLDGQLDGARASMQTPLLALKNDAQNAAVASDADFDGVSGKILMIGVIAGLLALVAGTVVNLAVVRHISRPLKILSDMLHKLVSGHEVANVPYESRRDEVGEIAHAVSAFKTNIIEVKRLEQQQAAAHARLEQDSERARQVMQSAEAFETSLKAVASRVGQTSVTLNAAALTLDEAAREASQRSVSMAGSTSQSSSNLQTVASATEELSASISEISRQVEETTLMTQAATDQAHKTSATVDNLAQAAAKIGDVVALIQSIASQTNLLALNATIEAARAGAAGAGFAVVAGEVKNLSAQTSRATNEIREHISSMRVVTDETVEAMHAISSTIERINGVTSSIAAGVTQQSAATAEIANNVAQVASGADTINADLARVSLASRQTSETSAKVLFGAGDLSDQVQAMSREVDTFLGLIRVRA